MYPTRMGTDTPDRAGVYGRQSKDKTKSITEQLAECTADAVEQGALVAATYRDGVSASRFTTKRRDDWPRVRSDVDAGKLDMLALWESSRGDRDAQTWLGLLATCRKRRVLIRITSHERTYDMGIARDRKSTRLNSSHITISYAVFCLKKKKKKKRKYNQKKKKKKKN